MSKADRRPVGDTAVVAAASYDTLAGVYDWLVPEALLTPQGSVAAFGAVVDELAPRARVLDCAAGTGPVAVGLALRGFDVVATDASGAMVERTRRLAAEHGADVRAEIRTWEQLAGAGWAAAFDAVLCVGNSLTHAAGRPARRAALRAMADVLRPGGLLAVTSRNWQLIRDRGSRLDVGERLVVRGGRAGLAIHRWALADGWDERCELEVAVAFVGEDGGVTTHAERLAFWPFSHAALHDDLLAAGLEPALSTYAPDAERYLVTARRGA
jgi:SAM-dependent methyltransferase